MTWDAEPRDIDLHVFAYRKDGGEECGVLFGTNCTGVFLDVDNEKGGLNGAETVTLFNNTVNSQYIYMIAVTDPKFAVEDPKFLKIREVAAFLKSGARILITNGI